MNIHNKKSHLIGALWHLDCLIGEFEKAAMTKNKNAMNALKTARD